MFISTFVIFSLILNCYIQAEVCTPNICNKHGTCLPTGQNSFTCQCDSGFLGATCNQEINECASNPCANNGTCMDLENGFLCRCLSEWNGTFCTERRNFHKRAFLKLDPCQSSPCGPVGKCIATNQPHIPYYCQCPDGQNTMFKCANPNPCQPNPCGPGICEVTANLLNGYICRCTDGTVQITNCSLTTKILDPCDSSPCGSQGRCLPLSATPKGYMCICQSGSATFTAMDTCPTNAICTALTCKNGGTCVSYSANEPSCSTQQDGSPCCQCPPNFTGSQCETELDFCSNNPCSPNGRCLSGKTGYRCQCFNGYTGENCEAKIPQNGCLSNPCTVGICYQLNKNGPAYVCICPDGTLSLSCNSSVKVDSSQNLFALPTVPSQLTTAMASLMYSHSGRYVGNHNHLSPMSTCNPSTHDVCNGGQCVVVGRSTYACRCREGYTGTYCETNINECASNPCLGGGTCFDLINAFACMCPDRIFRPQCNVTGAPAISKGTSVLMTASNHKVSQVIPNRFLQSDCQCRNGGLCLINPNGVKTCRCLNAFTGAFCELALTENRNLNPSPGQSACMQGLCQNSGTCQQQGLGAKCVCKPGFTGQRCETEYFRCQANGRFADPSSCKQGRYFECVYFGQYDLGLPNGVLYSRSCPPGLWFNALNDRCDYPSAVRC